MCTRRSRILLVVHFTEWLRNFSALHERARRGHLSGDDRDEYLTRRDDLTRALVAVQRRLAAPGANRRNVLRVSRALQVELEAPLSRERALTTTVSVGGFSALLAEPPCRDELLKCSLLMPGGEHIETTARPVGTKLQPGTTHVSFAFGKLDDHDRERLEMLIFETALEQLAEQR
jgi:hypothetical protein